jgi:flagellar M-ring protein FliF
MADGGKSGTGLATVGGKAAGSPSTAAMVSNLRARFVAMPSSKRTWLGVAAFAAAALIAAMTWYAGRPDWRILFSGLDSKDTQQIAQELSTAGIPYNLTEDGSGIEVSADQMDKARMEVAAKGMPQSGRMGFELFDKPNWVGSEFDEKVNYQRALEGELEHTIGTLAAVRSARVHLVMPKESLFGDAQQAAKASVVLHLRRASMAPEQVEAIRSLVAGAVENLNPENVALVDAEGRLNLGARGAQAAQGDAERGLEEKLVAMLEPTAGAGNVRATVNVAYDESSQEKTDEVYDPAQVAALTLHKTQQTAGGKPHASGVPGTASNTPGPTAAGAVAAAAAKVAAGKQTPPLLQAGVPPADGVQKEASLPVYPQSGAQTEGATTTEETGSYAVTRHLSHTEEGPGRIRRVTAAVVVNDRMEMQTSGKLTHVAWKPRSAEEMQRMEQLARAAVGFDTVRGDQVVVENVGFTSNLPEAVPTGMAKVVDQAQDVIHADPGLFRTLSLTGLGLFLMIAIVRPMTRQIATSLSQAPALALPSGQAANGMGVGRSVPSLASLVGAPRPKDTQGVYEHISEQIRREPTQSTRVLESWINAPVEEDE